MRAIAALARGKRRTTGCAHATMVWHVELNVSIATAASSIVFSKAPHDALIAVRGRPLRHELRQNVQSHVDICRRMVGADLKTNLFIAFGNNGIVEAGRQNAIPSQVSH